MKYSLSELKKYLLVKDLSEPKLVKTLSLISKGFTSDREKIKEYVSDEEFVSAYTCFYLPTNIPKLSFLLDQLPKDFSSSLKESHIVDLGTGPGTFAFAFDEYFNGEVQLTGVDSSELMVKQAEKLNEHLYKNSEINFSTTIPASFKDGTLFLGHSMNEMGVEKLLEVIDRHRPKNIILIEPGTSTVFNEVLKIRKELDRLSYNCLFPCANISLECPVEKKIKSGVEDWCHQVIRTTHDAEVERLSQLIKLDRKVMPLIAHVYTRGKVESNPKARMIRFLRETKFSFDWEVCLLEGSELKSIKFEVVKKSLSKKDIKYLQKISVGLDFEFEVIKELADDHLRVKLLNLNY